MSNFAAKEANQLAWLSMKLATEDLKIKDIFNYLLSSQVETHLDEFSAQLNNLVSESLELIESQLLTQDTIKLIKMLLRQPNGCMYLKIAKACSRLSSFVSRENGVVAVNLFHQTVQRKEYVKFSCTPVFNESGVFINELHQTIQEQDKFESGNMRLIRASDYIYEKTPVIVMPINTTCFNLTCVFNVSFSEHSLLVFCSERKVIVQCGDIEIDF